MILFYPTILQWFPWENNENSDSLDVGSRRHKLSCGLPPCVSDWVQL